MNYWLVRTDAPSVEVAKNGAFVTLWSRRVLKISIGDHLMYLERGDSPVFKRVGKVSEVQRRGEVDEKRRYETRIAVQEIRDLPPNLELDDMVYSLTLVHNTEKPWLHFRLGYRHLPKEDFETLTAGQPFVSRSGFYELLNALPEKLQAEFRIETIVQPVEGDRAEYYFLRFERLVSFIERRILKVGELLADVKKLTSELDLLSEDGHPYEHVFEDDSEDSLGQLLKPDGLAEQNRRFEDLRNEIWPTLPDMEYGENRGVVRQTLDEINQTELRQSEIRFGRLFSELG